MSKSKFSNRILVKKPDSFNPDTPPHLPRQPRRRHDTYVPASPDDAVEKTNEQKQIEDMSREFNHAVDKLQAHGVDMQIENVKIEDAFTESSKDSRLAGLSVKNKKGERLLIMSSTRLNDLGKDFIKAASGHYDHIVTLDMPTIEKKYGNPIGSIIAEVTRGR